MKIIYFLISFIQFFLQKMNKKLYNINYFEPAIQNEEYPLKLNPILNDKYRKLEMIFNLYFDENSEQQSKELSRTERDHKFLTDKSYAYGEVTFRSMAYIFEYAKNTFGINEEGIFYDFGSGSGKGIISALLCQNFKQYVAIEFLEDVIKKSAITIGTFLGNFSIYYSQMPDLLPKYVFPEDSNIPSISIKNGDFLYENIINASFIFINSTCFSTELMYNLSKKVQVECPPGCIVVTFTKKLPLINLLEWDIIPQFKRLMSWGIVTVFIHRKKTTDQMNNTKSSITSNSSKSSSQSSSSYSQSRTSNFNSASRSSNINSTVKRDQKTSSKREANISNKEDSNSSVKRDYNSVKRDSINREHRSSINREHKSSVNRDNKSSAKRISSVERKSSVQAINKNELVEALKLFDKDDKGVIPVEELRKCLYQFKHITHEEADEIIKEADVDKDGLVDYNEFAQVIYNK